MYTVTAKRLAREAGLSAMQARRILARGTRTGLRSVAPWTWVLGSCLAYAALLAAGLVDVSLARQPLDCAVLLAFLFAAISGALELARIASYPAMLAEGRRLALSASAA